MTPKPEDPQSEQHGQAQTYRLPGVQAEDGSTGTLVFTVKPGGNAHAEFEADQQQPAAPDQSLPDQQPVEPGMGAPEHPPEQGPEDPPAPTQQPS